MTVTGATFPYLELGPDVSDFDEAVILINGHEEETIIIECPGARELAERLVWLVNNFHTTLTKPRDEKWHNLTAALRAQAGDVP
jgi:hypothetical protein